MITKTDDFIKRVESTAEEDFFTPRTFYHLSSSMFHEMCELLKERDAVKPKSKVRHGANAQIQHFCGNCMTLLHGKPKYCSECGKKVYWHDR